MFFQLKIIRERKIVFFTSSRRNNSFDWARAVNQATAVDCGAILAIRAAGAVGIISSETP